MMAVIAESRFAPILIYGPRKGGTTLLQRLMDDGVSFCHPSETKIKMFPKLKRVLDRHRDAAIGFSDVEKFFPIAYEQEMGLDVARYRQNVLDGLKGIADVKSYIELHVQAVREAASGPGASGQAIAPFMIKEVGGNTAYVIRAFLEAYPNGRVVSIMRDARRVTRAVFRERRRRNVRLSLFEMIHEVVDPLLVNRAQRKLRGHDRVVTLRYEDLVADVQGQMDRVLEFCELPRSQIHYGPTFQGRPVVVNTSSRETSDVFLGFDRLADQLRASEFALISTGSFWLMTWGSVLHALRSVSSHIDFLQM